MKLDRLLRSNLKFKHLQLLLALDELRHVGKVAQFMHLTQPALSKSLAELELIVGVRLFDRSSKGTSPTSHGAALIQFARESLAQLDRVEEEFRAIDAGSAGTVHIGSMMAATALLIPRSVVQMKQRSANTTVRVDEGMIDTLLERLSLGQLDLIIGRLDAVKNSQGLILEKLYEEGVVVVCGPDNALAKRKRLSWGDLADLPWVLPPLGSTARSRFNVAWAGQGLGFHHDLVETGSFLTIFNLLRERSAVAILSASLGTHFAELGLLRILPLALPESTGPIGLILIEGKRVSPAAQLFCECVRAAATTLSVT